MRHLMAAAEAIAGYVDRGRDVFNADSAVREAIVNQIVVIGEAARTVTSADPSVATDMPTIEWSLLARMRDR